MHTALRLWLLRPSGLTPVSDPETRLRQLQVGSSESSLAAPEQSWRNQEDARTDGSDGKGRRGQPPASGDRALLNRVGESHQTGKGPSEGTGGRLPTCLRPAGKASESKFDQNISKQETLRQLLSTRPHHGEVLKGVLPAEGKGSHGCVETSAATGTGKRSCGGNR